MILREELAATDKITIVIKNLAVVANGVASKVLGIALNEAADGLAVLVNEALLVNLKTLENAQIDTISLVLN